MAIHSNLIRWNKPQHWGVLAKTEWLDRNLYILLFTALLLFSLAYQTRLPYLIGIGDGLDSPFASQFNDPEKFGHIPFRWTTAKSQITLPGLGGNAVQRLVLRINGYRPDGDLPAVTVTANGQRLGVFKAADGFHNYSFDISSISARSPDLRIKIATEPFSTPQDARPLGVMVQSIRLTFSSQSSLVTPAWSQVALLTLWVLSVYLLLLGLKFPKRMALGGGLLLLVSAAVALGWLRLWLTPIVPLLLVNFWIAGVLSLAAFYSFRAASLDRRDSSATSIGGAQANRTAYTERILGWLCLLFAFGVWFAYSGLTHPDFYPVDHIFRAHILSEFIQDAPRARLFYFTQPQSDAWGGNFVFPYPPTFDTLFAPVYAVIPTKALVTVMDLTGAVLFGASVFPLFFLAVLAFPSDIRAGLLAALAWVVMPINFLPLSDGAFPNILGQWFALVFLAGLAKNYSHLNRPRVFVSLTILLFYTFMAYSPTMVFLLIMLSVLATLRWLSACRPEERRQVKLLTLSVGVALGGALLVYYGSFVPLVITRTFPLMLQRLQTGSAVGHSTFMEGNWVLPSELVAHFRVFPFLAAWVAVWLLRPLDSVTRCIYIAALLALVPFLIIENWVNLYNKHMLAILPFIALGTGVLFAKVWKHGRLGHWATWVALGYLTLAGGLVWLERVFYYILPPGSGIEK